MNCGTNLIENGFQVAKFIFEVQKAPSLFCHVQKYPWVIRVAYISLRKLSEGSLRCARAFLEAFGTFCNTWDTQSQQGARMKFPPKKWEKKIYVKGIPKLKNYFLP